MLTHLSGVDIPDDNPALKFLQTVHLSVDDELRGNGSLGWTSNDAPQAEQPRSNKFRMD